ncbi:MAG TPA: aldehyde dehydrogenase family protein, partial [Myxococcales bacterium]|nr:aldehyde dehydrogenase family protein [Myxococcales bacterium]
MKEVLESLGLQDQNKGACWGANGWIEETEPTWIDSFNPSTNESIAQAALVGEDTYEQIVTKAQEAFTTWRRMPAPKRGEIIRELGDELRRLKEPLGKLVSLEMGKILQEGLGEVQEMIDICDLAVGMSRQLYGRTMHSERPEHRMYEQWHPL